MTPEGRIKKQVREVLKGFVNLYSFWPVPQGFGPSSLDCIVVFHGRMIAIETKAPGKKLTPRQHFYKHEIEAAGGKVFVIDGTAATDTIEDLERHLTLAEVYHGHETVPAGEPAKAGGHSG